MKNPNLKSKEDLKLEFAELSESEKNIIKHLIGELTLFHKTKKHITLQGLSTLEGFMDTLSVFTRTYSKRVITLLKEGNKLD